MKKAIAFSLLAFLALAVFPAAPAMISPGARLLPGRDFDLAGKPGRPFQQAAATPRQAGLPAAAAEREMGGHQEIPRLSGERSPLARGPHRHQPGHGRHQEFAGHRQSEQGAAHGPGFRAGLSVPGQEYSRRNNFPQAEEYFNKSLQYAAVPEFKILLAELT